MDASNLMVFIQIIVAVLMLLTLVVLMIKLRGMGNGNSSMPPLGYTGSLVEALKVVFQPLTLSISKIERDLTTIQDKMDKRFMTKEMCKLSHDAHDKEHENITKDLNGFGGRVSRVEKKLK